MSLTALLSALTNDRLYPAMALASPPSRFVIPQAGLVGAFGYYEAELAARVYIEFCCEHDDAWHGVSFTRLVLWEANRHQQRGAPRNLIEAVRSTAYLLGRGFETLQEHDIIALQPQGAPLADYIVYPRPTILTHARLASFLAPT